MSIAVSDQGLDGYQMSCGDLLHRVIARIKVCADKFQKKKRRRKSSRRGTFVEALCAS